MCGIFGYLDRSGRSIPGKILNAMGVSINHRGPDDHGLYIKDGVAIGNQRLSIIDIKGGHQPFLSEDGAIALVQNGEIFNYVELREMLESSGVKFSSHSDTEVLLHLYERHGIDFVKKLNGMFSIAIYDSNIQVLYLIRDRVGVKPIYYYNDGARFVFSSEIKSILKAGVEPVLNVEALDEFLSYNYIPPPNTIFNDIYHVMPGHVLSITKDSTESFAWWNLLEHADCQVNTDDYWQDAINVLLDDAVKIRMRSDAPFGAFLSGGIDSSTVVGLMSKHSNQPVSTYSIGFDDKRFDESVFAKEASERFGTKHHSENVSLQMTDLWPLVTYHNDQPHGDVSFMPTYRVSQLAARDVKMVLTGDGGDELFAGYDKYRDFYTRFDPNSISDVDFQKNYTNNISLFTDQEKEYLYSTNTKRQLNDHNPWHAVETILGDCKGIDRINQSLLIDMLLLLPGNNLVKPDRMAMAVSLETRTPFLDYRMMELAFKIPGQLKLKNNETKYILKRAVAPLIGNSLTYRKKQMFTVPIGEWLKGDLYESMRNLLLSPSSLARQLFNIDYIEKMMGDHLNEVKNYTRQLRALMALEIWYAIFIEDQGNFDPNRTYLT
jgi:asparagine synthase (glutamine-hydrolysing)